MNSGIYTITNTVNGKIYVGSAANFNKRWDRHLTDLIKSRHCNVHLQRAFDLYGNVFAFKILEVIPYHKDLIVQRENYWMSKLNSKNPKTGYNIADASFGNVIEFHPLKDEILKKISISLKRNYSKMTESERREKHGRPSAIKGKTIQEHYGVERSAEISKSMSIAQLNRNMGGKGNPFYGKTHTSSTREKISAVHKGKDPGNRKPVIAQGLRFSCCREAAEYFNTKTTVMRRMCASTKPEFAEYYFV